MVVHASVSRTDYEELETILGYTFRDRGPARERAAPHALVQRATRERARRRQRAARVPRRRRARSRRRPPPDGPLPRAARGRALGDPRPGGQRGRAVRGRRRARASATGSCSARARRRAAAGASRRSSPTPSRRSSRRSTSTAASTPRGRWSAGCCSTRIETVEFRRLLRLQDPAPGDGAGPPQATPTYRVVAELGPDHDKRFVVAVMIGGDEWARAEGRSKKEAEQTAAAEAAFRLEADMMAQPTESRRLGSGAAGRLDEDAVDEAGVDLGRDRAGEAGPRPRPASRRSASSSGPPVAWMRAPSRCPSTARLGPGPRRRRQRGRARAVRGRRAARRRRHGARRQLAAGEHADDRRADVIVELGPRLGQLAHGRARRRRGSRRARSAGSAPPGSRRRGADRPATRTGARRGRRLVDDAREQRPRRHSAGDTASIGSPAVAARGARPGRAARAWRRRCSRRGTGGVSDIERSAAAARSRSPRETTSSPSDTVAVA